MRACGPPAGAVHRDLKPANVLVSELEEGKQPLVKLADFGVSTLLAGQEDTTTEEGTPPSHMHISASQPPIMNPIRLALQKYDEGNPDGNTMTALGVMDTPSLDSDERALLTSPDPMYSSAPPPPEAQPGSRSGSQPSLKAVSNSGSQPSLKAVSKTGSKSGSQPSLQSGSKTGSKSGSQPSVRAASRSGEHDDHLTETGILVGTPMYMAPELSEGSRFAKPPSDIFSLGVIAYELLTGEIPFNRPPVWARWRGSETPAPSLATKRPELAPALIELVDSCLRLDPAQRPTAAAIAAALILQPQP